MINSPMKSRSSSPKSFVFRTYANPTPQLLSFQHLRELSVSADSKGTLSPSDSAVTTPLFLTSLESAVTKKQGEGGGVIMACPERSMREVNQIRPALVGICFLFCVLGSPGGVAGQAQQPAPASV